MNTIYMTSIEACRQFKSLSNCLGLPRSSWLTLHPSESKRSRSQHFSLLPVFFLPPSGSLLLWKASVPVNQSVSQSVTHSVSQSHSQSVTHTQSPTHLVTHSLSNLDRQSVFQSFSYSFIPFCR